MAKKIIVVDGYPMSYDISFSFRVKHFLKSLFFYRIYNKKNTILPLTDEIREKAANSTICIVIATHGLFDFFKRCLTEAIKKCGVENVEFVIWSNNAGAETEDFVEKFEDRRVRLIKSKTNIGLNGYSAVFNNCQADYFLFLDHDVISFSDKWLYNLLIDYIRTPKVKFLAANVLMTNYSGGSRWPLSYYQRLQSDQIELFFGPAGGWCTLTDRKTYMEVGGIPYIDKVYFLHDKYYLRNLFLRGYKCAISNNALVYHASNVAKKFKTGAINQELFFKDADDIIL